VYGLKECLARDTSFAITVLPNPTINNIPANDTLCNGEKTQPVAFSGVITNYEWNISGNIMDSLPVGTQRGNFEDYVVHNLGYTLLTANVTVTPMFEYGTKTCIGTDASFSITVFPEPTLTNLLPNDTLCDNEQTKAVEFSGAANLYEWTSSGSISGIPASGTGDFDKYIVDNKGNIPTTAHITITPKFTHNGKTCVGEDTVFSITVYPVPALTNLLENDTLCDGEQTKSIVFTGAELYEWIAAGDNISGLPTGVQTGDFVTYTLTNKTANRISSVIKVTPKYLISRE
jgi:hypothetical protein